MTYNVLMGTLNPTHSLTHSLTLLVGDRKGIRHVKYLAPAITKVLLWGTYRDPGQTGSDLEK